MRRAFAESRPYASIRAGKPPSCRMFNPVIWSENCESNPSTTKRDGVCGSHPRIRAAGIAPDGRKNITQNRGHLLSIGRSKVTDIPFHAVCMAEQSRRCQEQLSPSPHPEPRVAAVSRLKDCADRIAVSIHVLRPIECGKGIMLADQGTVRFSRCAVQTAELAGSRTSAKTLASACVH